jgi:hypothetical protein
VQLERKNLAVRDTVRALPQLAWQACCGNAVKGVVARRDSSEVIFLSSYSSAEPFREFRPIAAVTQ